MKKKLLVLFLVAAMSITSLAGCSDKSGSSTGESSSTESSTTESSKEEESTPEVELMNDDSIKEFTLAAQMGGDVNPEMSEWWLWKEYEEQTGIHINWRFIQPTAVAEQKNLIMASNDKPDGWWGIGFSYDEMVSYGASGSLLNIAPYIDTYLPNLKTELEKIEGGMASLPMSDGKIYSMVEIMDDLPQITCRYYLNQNWLDNLGLPVPTTIDELTSTFEEFKTKDANNNGDANDEYPVYLAEGMIGQVEQLLAGSYGIGNHGVQPLAQWYYLDDSNTPQFLYDSEQMKQVWQLLSDWWSKGYMHPETFGKLAYEKWVTDGKADKVGMYTWVTSNYLYTDAYKDYTPVPVFQGPDTSITPVMSWTDFPVRDNGSFTITDACKAPGTLMKWADYFYTDEGVNFSWFGKEGETYNLNADGKPVYVDEINNYEQGAQLGAFQYGLLVYGSFPTRFPVSKEVETARKLDGPDAKGERLSDHDEDCAKYCPKVIMPGLKSTIEEGSQLSALTTDMGTYITESRVKFVTGEWNFESDWDAYVKKLQQMGSGDFLKIRQDQYARFVALGE